MHLTEQRFLTSINNNAPLVGLANGSNPPLDLPDISMTPGSSQTVNLTTADADGDAVVLHAAIQPAGPAADLQRQFKLYEYVAPSGPTYFQSSQWDNGKWLFSAVNGSRYLLLPDGTVKQWAAGATTVDQLTLVTTLDPSVYTDPTLFTAALTPPATVSLVGKTMTITTAAGYTGSYRISVSATDGLQTTTQTFTVTVNDQSPELPVFVNQVKTVSRAIPPVPLNAVDPDGDPVTVLVSVTADNAAAALERQLGLYAWQGGSGPNYFVSPQWNNAKWLWSAVNGQRYLILPDGEVRQWTPGETTVAATTLITTLDASIYADPLFLTNLLSLPVTTNVTGNTLTVTPQAGFIGSFWVNVTVTDGVRWTDQRFWVSVLS